MFLFSIAKFQLPIGLSIAIAVSESGGPKLWNCRNTPMGNRQTSGNE